MLFVVKTFLAVLSTENEKPYFVKRSSFRRSKTALDISDHIIEKMLIT